MAHYFTEETDKALAEFLSTDDHQKKHAIFNDRIRPAFEKLIESLINVYRFHKIDDKEILKRDCLANLYEMIPKYDVTKATKGFSYFNVVAKNWFIHKLRELAKKNKLESDLYSDLDRETVKNDPNFRLSPFEDVITEKEFWKSLFSQMDTWKTKLTKKPDRQVLEAIVFLLRNPDLVTIYNKKASLLYLRELTGLNSKQIMVSLKRIKELYDDFKDQFHDHGEILSEADEDSADT